MSAELKDFRLGITAEIDAALTAVARAFGRDKQDVAREILGEWAARKHVEARILSGLAHANGAMPASGGTVAEDAGTSRQNLGIVGKQRTWSMTDSEGRRTEFSEKTRG